MFFGIDLSTYFALWGIPVVAIKIGVCLLAIYFMFRYRIFATGCGFKKLSIWYVLIAYMMMLFLRLLVDFVIPWKGFFLYTSPITILLFFFVTMLVPMFFFGNKGMKIDTMKWSVIMGVFLCICMAVSFRNNMMGLAAVSLNGQHQGEGTVDIISYGHYGCTLILMGLYIYLEGIKKSRLWLCALFVLVGFSAVVLSGSRGPVVALVLCGILLFASRTKRTYTIVLFAILFFVLVSLLSTFIYQFNDFLESRGIVSFSRIIESTILYSGSGTLDSSGREDIYNMGWRLFSENMLAGTSLLLPDGSYVHNIFIEQFMALGIFGGSIFIILNIALLKYCWAIFKKDPKNSLFPALFIQYMVFGLFSRTIIALIPYWLFMFVTLNIYSGYKKTSYDLSYNSNIQRSRRLA